MHLRSVRPRVLAAQHLRLRDLPRSCIGEADVAHLGGLDEVVESAHGLLDWREAVPIMEVVQIDVVGLQGAQGPFAPRSIGRLVAVSVSAFLTSSAAHATDVILTGDAHVSLTRSTTNFGTLSNLYVGNANTVLLQFDLNTLPSGLTASQVSRATLTVFVNRVNSGGTVSLSPVTSAWSESGVTYATSPTIGTPINSFTAVTAGQFERPSRLHHDTLRGRRFAIGW